MLSTPQANPAVLPGQSLLLSGFNPDIDSGSVPEDVWPQGGTIAFPSAAAVVDIVSTSALDTAAGTGARTITVLGVDGNFDIISEVVTMNGLTPVATIALFLFVQTSIIKTVGSTELNQGVISFTIDGNLCNIIAALKGQTQAAAAIIPNAQSLGTSAHLVSALAVVGKQPAVFATVSLTRRRSTSGIFTETLDIPISSRGGPLDLQLIIPVIFAAGEQVVARVTQVSANNILVSSVLQFSWLSR